MKTIKMLTILFFLISNFIFAQEESYSSNKRSIVKDSLVQLPFHSKPQLIKVNVVGDKAFYQGDIVLKDFQNVHLTYGVAAGWGILNNLFLWPDNTMYYRIEEGHPLNSEILQAIKHIKDKTNLKLFPATNSNPNFVNIISTSEIGGCYSAIGM